jgi:hypothetical protein
MFVAIIMLVITLWVLGLAIAFVHAHIFGIVVFLVATGLLIVAYQMFKATIYMAIEAFIRIKKSIQKIPDTDEDKLARYSWRVIMSDLHVAEIEEKVKKAKERKNSRYY